MILYRLRCNNAHEFEGWFQNADAFEKQAESGLLQCPTCGSAEVGRALMAPAVRSTKRDVQTPAETAAANLQAAELKQQLRMLRRKIEETCDPVGNQFAEEARKIHYGEAEARGIYGDTTPEEASALRDEGIEFGAVPWLRDDA